MGVRGVAQGSGIAFRAQWDVPQVLAHGEGEDCVLPPDASLVFRSELRSFREIVLMSPVYVEYCKFDRLLASGWGRTCLYLEDFS